MKVANFIQGLRDFADWLEAHPVLPPTLYGLPNGRILLFVKDKDQLAAAARWLGTCEKVVTEDWFSLVKTFGPIALEALIERPQVCERVKIGEKVIPAQPERVLPAEPERVEEVYEWQCPESILNHTLAAGSVSA